MISLSCTLVLRPSHSMCNDHCTACCQTAWSSHPELLWLCPVQFQCNKSCSHLFDGYIQIVVTSGVFEASSIDPCGTEKSMPQCISKEASAVQSLHLVRLICCSLLLPSMLSHCLHCCRMTQSPFTSPLIFCSPAYDNCFCWPGPGTGKSQIVFLGLLVGAPPLAS